MNSHRNARLTLEGRKLLVERIAGLELSSLKALYPVAPIVRFEREAPGELLHIDTKKLGRIAQPSHRVTGDRRDATRDAGWESAHVAIEDHSRADFVQMHEDKRKGSAVAFLQAAVAHYAALGVTIKHLITNNGRSIDRNCSPGLVQPWASSTLSPSPIARRPTARLSDSSKPACVSGPMTASGPTVMSELLGCRPSWACRPACADR